MNGGILPFILLGLSLGLALSTVEKPVAWRNWALASAAALAMSFMPIPARLRLPIEIGLWASTAVTAATAYLRGHLAKRVNLPVAANAGAWLGAFATASATRPALLAGLFIAMVFVPIRLFSSSGSAIAVRVVASWMIAISALAVFVSMLPTPGYTQDHME